MLNDLSVYVSIWVSMTAWFVGAISRELATHQSLHCKAVSRMGTPYESVYRWSWLAGAILLSIHIIASYEFVHHWSHEAALEATGVESFQVTGYRASWGVYVNFAFMIVWIGYSFAMVYRRSRVPRLDPLVIVFLAPIVFSATVVFETGVLRTASIVAFFLLIGLTWRRIRLQHSVQRNTETSQLSAENSKC